jgi:hypothetical protein
MRRREALFERSQIAADANANREEKKFYFNKLHLSHIKRRISFVLLLFEF